jgi:CheY-like chemotaxis protein
MKTRKRILWVDDQIDGLHAYVGALQADGFLVETAASTYDALILARDAQYDIVLVDILMPPPDGIELLRQIRPLQPHAALAALSSFLYLDRYREQLRNLNFPVGLIEKDLPNIEAEDFEQRFLIPIHHLAQSGRLSTITEQDYNLRNLAASNEDPFSIPLVEFMKKPILEKDSLTLRAKELAERTLQKAFSEGRIWVLLCGAPEPVRASASTPGDVLPEEQVMEFARSQQRAPFQFWRPVQVDDFWSSCGEANRNYPTVTLDFGREALVVHFDTGAPMTFFSYEELLRIGAILPTTNFGLSARNGLNYWTVQLNIPVLLRSQDGGGARSIVITGQAVRDWEEAPYARHCDETCSLQRPGHLCRGRTALVGRNVLTENQIVLILDGVNCRTILGG